MTGVSGSSSSWSSSSATAAVAASGCDAHQSSGSATVDHGGGASDRTVSGSSPSAVGAASASDRCGRRSRTARDPSVRQPKSCSTLLDSRPPSDPRNSVHGAEDCAAATVVGAGGGCVARRLLCQRLPCEPALRFRSAGPSGRRRGATQRQRRNRGGLCLTWTFSHPGFRLFVSSSTIASRPFPRPPLSYSSYQHSPAAHSTFSRGPAAAPRS